MTSPTHNAYQSLVHFMPETGWINDPNGLVYFNDQWHLFYQYYNAAEVDGMQWGHAISDDLVHWQHLPVAIPPDQLGHIFSGSAVVDHHDSSGFFGGKAGMVCLYTYNDMEDNHQSQGLAYSADGIHFTVYEGNPVIPKLRDLDGHPDDRDFRDPKIIWHEPTQKWVMIVAGGKFRVFSSDNLIDWDFEHCHDDIVTECPDLFELPIDGDPDNTTWVLSLCGREYLLGDFDGKKFTPTSERLRMTGGPDFYASQSWSDAPDDRRIMISWIFNWTYNARPNPDKDLNTFPTGSQSGNCQSLPYEMSLRTTADGVRLFQYPVQETEQLWGAAEGSDQESTRCFSMQCDFDTTPREDVVIHLATHGETQVRFGYDAASACLFIDRSDCGFETDKYFAERFESAALIGCELQSLRVIVDASSIELFANEGEQIMSAFVMVEEDPQMQIAGREQARQVRVQSLQVPATV